MHYGDEGNCPYCNYPGKDNRKGTPEELKRRDYLRDLEIHASPGSRLSEEINRECKKLILRIAAYIDSCKPDMDCTFYYHKAFRELEQIKNIIEAEGDYDD